MGSEHKRIAVLIAIFAVTAFLVHVAAERRGLQGRQPDWNAVPLEFGAWRGTDTQFDPLFRGADPADTSLLRVYRPENGAPIIVYVGFYSDLLKIIEVHTPELCYPAQGWTIFRSMKSDGGSYHGKGIRAQEIVVDKSRDRRIVMWWYNAGAKPFEYRIRYVFAALALSTLTGRTDGSMVRLETQVVSGDETAARRRIEQFQKEFVPMLDKALPN
jgi:EpsI family protein